MAAFLAGLLVFSGAVHARETLTWLLRDLPPLTIFEGPQKNQGAIDRFMPLLIAGLPEYEQRIMRVNRARGMQMLLEPGFTCDPSLLWSPERAQRLAFSIPAYRIRSNGIVIRHQDRGVLAPYLIDNQVDLTLLLVRENGKLGVVAERSYGQVVDRILQQAPNNSLSSHYGNDALGSLLQMQRLGRLSVLLGYWPEIRYQAQQQGISPDELEFYGIRGTDKYQSIHIACSDTPLGRQAIQGINATLRDLRQNRLVEFYAQWLDPQMRDEYREDARTFFQEQTP
nr:TIGR02285 family protein [Pseudomonas sp. FW300-N1A1]